MFSSFKARFTGKSFTPYDLSPYAWYTDSGTVTTTWSDISGNARSLTQFTTANRPAIVTNALNGRQVRRFDGTDKFFHRTSMPSALGDYTILVIHKYNSLVSSGNGWEGLVYVGVDNTRATSNTGQLHLQRINLTNGIGGHNAGVATTSINVDTGAGGLLVPRISCISRQGGTNGNGGTVSVRSNNLTTTGTQSWTTSATTPTGFMVGGRQQTVVPYTNADIGEIIVFNRAITETERDNLFQFFSTKWSITV